MPNGLNALIATAGGYQAPDWDKGAANAMSLQAGQMKLEDEKILRPMRNEMETLKYFRDTVPLMTPENYPQMRAHLINRGVPEIALPPYIPPEKFPEWQQKVGLTVAQKMQLDSTGSQEWKPTTKEEAIEVAGAKASVRKVGDKQTYQVGDQEVTERWNGTEWERVGTGPKWAPPAPKEDKPPTEKYTKDDKLIADALREELGGIEPTASQILQKKKQLAREMAGERRTHVLPEKAMDNMSGALDSIRLIDELGSVADEAFGIPGVGQAKMWGKSKLGYDKAQLFLNNLRQLKINAQSLIKGIPSNFDVQTFINSLPKEDDTPKEVRTKVEIARKMLEDALIIGMQNYEKQYEIPEYMRERYEAANIKGSLAKQGVKPGTAPQRQTIRYDANGNRIE